MILHGGCSTNGPSHACAHAHKDGHGRAYASLCAPEHMQSPGEAVALLLRALAGLYVPTGPAPRSMSALEGLALHRERSFSANDT